jgi:predicted flap endonuclease-1-like 5' DNA nuclease
VNSSEQRDGSTRAALKEKDDKIFHLSRELENWQNRLPPLIERYRQRDGEARQLEDELAAARARIHELENRMEPGETRIEPVDQEALGEELDASNDPANVTYTGLEAVLADPADGEVVEDHDDIRASEDDLDVDLEDDLEDDLDDEAQYEPEDEAPAHARPAAAIADITELHEREPGGLRDNLRLIKGIGPAIEKTLNELGIFRYHQIAEMTEYDINRVAQRLKGFSSRIYREDWIGQARDLQLEKSGT